MNKRPFLTVVCFLLFAMAFVSANVKPATLYNATSMVIEPESVQRLVADVRQMLHDAARPREAD